jgi:hypothetical protein
MSLYLERLADRDHELLARVSGFLGVAGWHSELVTRPQLLQQALESRELYEALFRRSDDEALVQASPFLVFASLLGRVARELREAAFVNEWSGPGQRVPVFDVEALRSFLADPARRFFLVELLASFSQVRSGRYWVRTERGVKARRFSEMDPMSLLELAENLEEREREAVYQRLGDVSLFLTGVFPDFTARQRTLLEQLGPRSYLRAAQRRTDRAGTLLREMATHFVPARGVLNLLTDRHLFPYRNQWFALWDVDAIRRGGAS